MKEARRNPIPYYLLAIATVYIIQNNSEDKRQGK
jgi:hypothetical protein